MFSNSKPSGQLCAKWRGTSLHWRTSGAPPADAWLRRGIYDSGTTISRQLVQCIAAGGIRAWKGIYRSKSGEIRGPLGRQGADPSRVQRRERQGGEKCRRHRLAGAE